MVQKIEEARVRQKADTLENWMNNDLNSLDGEQLFVRSDVDDEVIGFKLGSKNKKFSELPYPDYSVRGKVKPTSTWIGRQSGVYIPSEDGLYNGITVRLSDGYQVLYWDGSTLEKVLYPIEYTNLVFGGIINDTADLSSPTNPIWYIASPGTYNTEPPITLTSQSILTFNGDSWSYAPFELEIRGEFLVAENVQELRGINAQIASLLSNGTYKGVILLGYYTKDDTPNEIIYYVSSTTKNDDGGSVFDVSGIKLAHDFDIVNPLYFGLKYDGVTDNTTSLQASFNLGKPVEYIVKGDSKVILTAPIVVKNSFTSNAWFKFNSNTSCFVITSKLTEGLLRVTGKMIVEGSFDENPTTVESQHGFNIQNVKDVLITDVNVMNTKGDSIYVSNHADNVEVKSCVLTNPRRNLVSFINCNNVRILNNQMSKPFDYVVGIDLEANNSSESITNILIEGNTLVTPNIALNVASVGSTDGVIIRGNSFKALYGVVAQPNADKAIKNVTIDDNYIDAAFPILNEHVFDLKSKKNNSIKSVSSSGFTEVSALNITNKLVQEVKSRDYNIVSLPKTKVDRSGVYKILRYQGSNSSNTLNVTSSALFTQLTFNSGMFTTGEDTIVGKGIYKINLPPAFTGNPYKIVATNGQVPVNLNDLIYFQVDVKITDSSINQVVIRKLPNTVIVSNVSKALKVGEWVTIKGVYKEESTTPNNGGLSFYLYKSTTTDSKSIYIKNITMINCTTSGIDMTNVDPVELENAINIFNNLGSNSVSYTLPSMDIFDYIDYSGGRYVRTQGTKILNITSKTWSSNGVDTGGYYEFTSPSDSDVVGTDITYGSVFTSITLAEGYKGGGFNRTNSIRIHILKSVIDAQSGATIVDKFNSFISGLGRTIYLYLQLKVPIVTYIDPLPDLVLTPFSNVTISGIVSLDVVNMNGFNDKILKSSSSNYGISKQALSLPSGSTTDQLIQVLKDAGLMAT